MTELQTVVIIVAVAVVIIALFICIMLMYYFYVNFKKQALIHPGLKYRSKVSTEADAHHEPTESLHKDTKPHHEETTTRHEEIKPHHGETNSHHKETLSRHEETETHHGKTNSHHKETLSRHEETETHHGKTNSHHKETLSRHEETETHHGKTNSHHKETLSRHEETETHHKETMSMHEKTEPHYTETVHTEMYNGIHAGPDIQNGHILVKQNGVVLPKAVLDVKSGQIVKPALCISKETLELYRNMCRSEARSIMAPPRKVSLLYDEKNMKKFQQEHRRAFGSLDSVQETRQKSHTSYSRVKIASFVKQDSYNPLNARGQRNHHVSDVGDNFEGVYSSQDTLQTLITQRSYDSLLSGGTNNSLFKDNGSAVDSVNEYFVEPADGSVVEPAIGDQKLNRSLTTLSCQSETLIDHFVKPADVDIGSIR